MAHGSAGYRPVYAPGGHNSPKIMVDNTKLVEMPTDARGIWRADLEAFTRKIIALILGRVKYFFTQRRFFKVGGQLELECQIGKRMQN
jgi:hypothetical protein